MGSVDQILIFASAIKKKHVKRHRLRLSSLHLFPGKIIESYRFLLLLILSNPDAHVDKTMKSFSFYHLCRLETPLPNTDD